MTTKLDLDMRFPLVIAYPPYYQEFVCNASVANHLQSKQRADVLRRVAAELDNLQYIHSYDDGLVVPLADLLLYINQLKALAKVDEQ